MFKNKKFKLLVAFLIIIILVIVLLYVMLGKASNEVSSINGMNTKESYNIIPKEQFNLNNISRINIVYHYEYTTDKTLEISVTGEQANKCIQILDNYEYPDKSNLLLAIEGKYEVNLLNGTKFLFDDYSSLPIHGAYINNDKRMITEIPNELYTLISETVNSELEKIANIYNTNQITINTNDKKILVQDSIAINKYLEYCKYIYDIDTFDDTATPLFQIIFNTETKLDLYTKRLGKLYCNNTEKYVKLPEKLIDFTETIINNYNNNIDNILDANIIKLQKNSNSIEITDLNTIEYIKDFIKYTKIYYNKEYNYEAIKNSISRQDIIISLGEVIIIIPISDNAILQTGYILYPDKTAFPLDLNTEFISYIKSLV